MSTNSTPARPTTPNPTAPKPTAAPVHIADTAPAHRTEARSTGRLVLAWGAGRCLCGCGSSTLGRFAPGHDARLRGALARAVATGHGVRVREDGAHADVDAMAVAALLDSPAHSWTAWIRKAAEDAKRRQADAAKRAKEAAAKKAAAAAARPAANRPSIADLLKAV